ncbi:hypothetical protein [Leifsonia sp. 71-9]|uniref:hypothetical protein n=1 Tax=Leifsonia sp. 71-9 TaxID=1895934 RepID=UPI00092A2535|nr:hypothetical protein [Leifsonia sp. 71-9]OJX73311.1 MAG: hypothetical protein BGO91_16595 [Leifsonia sp. 71-9]
MRGALRAVVASALVVLAAGVLGVSGGSPAQAGWSRSAYVTGTATAGVLGAVPTVACGSSGGLLAANIPITWTAAPTGGNALAPQSYTIAWSGSAGSGSTTVAAPATSGSVTGATLTLLGTSTVTVTANYGTWTSPVSLQTRTITTVLGALSLIVAWTCA